MFCRFFLIKVVGRFFYSRLQKGYYRYQEKSRQKTIRYLVSCSVEHMIQSAYLESCLEAQKLFLLFKGPGPFKIYFKIGGNLEEVKAYRWIPLTPSPPPWSFHSTGTFNEVSHPSQQF